MRKWIEIVKVLRELKVKSSRAATLITYRQLTLIIKPNNVELWVDGNLWLEPDFLKICCIKEPIYENSQQTHNVPQNCELSTLSNTTRT